MLENQARYLNQMIDANNETQAHIYLEQLLLFPVDVQDKIIEEVSQLQNCSSEAIAKVLSRYAMLDLE